MAKKRTNVAGTERLQLSLDPVSYGLLGKVAEAGMYGRSHAEVASFVVREWLSKNSEETIISLSRLRELSGVDDPETEEDE